MTGRDVVVELLEHYVDVLEGLQDGDGASSDDEFLALMCEAWNHPSYRELERLRLRLRSTDPAAYWHLAGAYFRPERRRVMRCVHGWETGHEAHNYRDRGRCRFSISVGAYRRAKSLPTHTHMGRRFALAPATVRVVSPLVDRGVVGWCVVWMVDRWDPRVPLVVPDDLAGVKAAA